MTAASAQTSPTSGPAATSPASPQSSPFARSTASTAIPAAALVAKGSRGLPIDLDPQGNATSGLGVSKDEPQSVYGVLVRDEPLEKAVYPTAVDGLDLLPSSLEMTGAEVELVPLMAREF